MSELSPNLLLPYLQPSQAQKHVTHNEAIERLDVLAQLVLEAFATVTPPASPVEGEAHGIATGATDAWSGQDGRIAAWLGGAWVFIVPQDGWRAWSRSDGALRVWTGSDWALATGDFNDLAGLGIGADWDATNRLVVTSPATLFTHDGSGHQLKLNKAAPSDTASLLFQTDFAGRAEFGLTGSDDFAIKVSDGAGWTDALTVDHLTGAVSLPAHPKFSGYCDYDQAIPADSWTRVDINALRHDASAAVSTGVFTAPHAGPYLFGGSIRILLTGSAPNAMLLGFSINGASPSNDRSVVSSEGTAALNNTSALQMTACLSLAAGDTVELMARFNVAGASLDAEHNYFWGTQLP